MREADLFAIFLILCLKQVNSCQSPEELLEFVNYIKIWKISNDLLRVGGSNSRLFLLLSYKMAAEIRKKTCTFYIDGSLVNMGVVGAWLFRIWVFMLFLNPCCEP